VGVLVGLLLIRATGIFLFDPLIALGVAALITVTAFRLTWKSLGALMDAKLPDAEEEIVANIVQDHSSQAMEFHNLRTRKAGSHRHIDLHLVVQKDTHVEDAHQLCDHLEEEIRAALPRSTVNIHIEPDSVFDRRRKDQAEVQERAGASGQDDQAPPS